MADDTKPPKPQTPAMAYCAWGAAVSLLLAYEAYALITNHETLSRTIWNADRSQYGPLLPFLAGGLCGHFFWSGN
jgi:hypothetical protein